MKWGSRLSANSFEWAELMQKLADCGYDYAEIPGDTLARMSDEEFQRTYRLLRQQTLPTPVAFALLPPEWKLVGPEARTEEAVERVGHLFGRLKELGVQLAVWDGGEARTLPKAFPRDRGEAQIEKFVQGAVQAAEEHGLTWVIAPVNRKESNMLRTVEEAAELAARLYSPNVKVCADSGDMLIEREEYESLSDTNELYLLAHAYASDRDRAFPGQPAEAGVDFAAYVNALRAAGYDQRITLYGRYNGPEDLIAKARIALSAIRRDA